MFAGRPFDLLDAALTDTVASFPVDVTPFYDMIDGMRMDLVKSRYETFTELAEYCYRVAGTVRARRRFAHFFSVQTMLHFCTLVQNFPNF